MESMSFGFKTNGSQASRHREDAIRKPRIRPKGSENIGATRSMGAEGGSPSSTIKSYSFEIWQGDLMVVAGSAPTQEEADREMRHYLWMYMGEAPETHVKMNWGTKLVEELKNDTITKN